VDLEQGHWGDNFRSPKGETIGIRTIFWGEGTLWGVTVGTGDWGITVGVVIAVDDILVIITVGVKVDVTVGGTLVVTVGEGVVSQWLELGGVGCLYRVDRSNHPHHSGRT